MGLPTSLLLSKSGYNVYGYDIDKKKLSLLKSGNLPFEEKGFKKLFDEATSFEILDELIESDVFIITVPTPFNRDRKCDTSFIIYAIENINNVLKDGDLVVLESTVTPGTTLNVVKPLLDKTGKKYFLSYVSEKAIPGNTIYEMKNNVRIIGGVNKVSAEKAKKLYSSFVKSEIIVTDCNTAEMVKLMENTYRDVNIALANEFAMLSPNFNINIWEAIELANKHPRVNIHKPGPGVGGHCISIDPWFLISEKSKIISKAREINDSMPNYVFDMVKNIVNTADSPVITVFGVSYKGNVDDTRNTPALKFIEKCLREHYKIKIYDPHVKDFNYELVDLKEAVDGSDCIVIITDHDEFRKIDPSDFNMRNQNVFDTRNIIDYKTWEEAGFNVKILGFNEINF